jgi:hypothetical protein
MLEMPEALLDALDAQDALDGLDGLGTLPRFYASRTFNC